MCSATPTPPTPSADLIEQLRRALDQFYKDIHQLQLDWGSQERSLHEMFESAKNQANSIVQLCGPDLAKLIRPIMGKQENKFLFNCRLLANKFLSGIIFKYGGISEEEESLLLYLESKIKDCLDIVQSINPVSQPQKGPCVILKGQGERPIVLDEEQEQLTIPGYKVIRALLEAKGSLTKDELVKNSGHEDAVNILKRLKNKPGWEKVIQLPGKSGRGYRISC